MSANVYAPSSRIGFSAIPWSALLLACTPVAAAIYAYCLVTTPFEIHILVFLVMMAFGGAGVGMLAHRGRIRHPRFMRTLITVLGILFLACHWVAYEMLDRLAAASTTSFPTPVDLLRMWWNPSETMRFTLLGWQLPWLLLFVVWLCEGFVLVWLAREVGAGAAGEPYCETTCAWCDKHVLEQKFSAVLDLPGLAHRVGQDPRRLLDELAPCRMDDPAAYAQVTVYDSPACCFVTIENMRCVQHGSKVRASTHDKLEYLVATGVARQDIEALAHVRHGAGAHHDPVELITAIADFQADRFAAALTAAAPHRMAQQPALRCDALRLCALATGHLEQWEASLEHWQALFLEQPGAMTALQIATSAVMAGHLSVGETWLERARTSNRETREMKDTEMLIAYLSALERTRRFDAGMPCIEEVKNWIIVTGITDPTFLMTSGLPPFGIFLSKSALFVLASLDAQCARAWYEEMAIRLDDTGQKTLAAWIEQHLEQPAVLRLDG